MNLIKYITHKMIMSAKSGSLLSNGYEYGFTVVVVGDGKIVLVAHLSRLNAHQILSETRKRRQENAFDLIWCPVFWTSTTHSFDVAKNRALKSN